MIISLVEEKTLDKIQHPFIMKTFKKVEVEGTYLNIIKAIYRSRDLQPTSYSMDKNLELSH